jgi:SAM-dependent methyltransferase
LIVEQIIEPGEEQALKQNMASLVAISTDSAHVRDMYESNPYPRWLDLPPGRLAIRQAHSLVDILAMHVPGCDLSYFARRSKAQILIAGCGTGSNIALSYRKFRFCKITALDLSLSSLAYAQRKASQLRDAEIEFLHGDILGLKMVGRDFDIIESYGVLHHMKNPMEGWRILVERLQPGGLMFIGLYSRKARRAIDQIRTELAAQNSDGSIVEIRAARKRLLALPTDDPRRKAMGCEDFYSVSGCRDLLFHVQETNYDLGEIKSMIDALGLKFIDLQLDQNTRRAIQQDYPQLGSLDYQEQWLDFYSAFEDRHPDTFIQMYQLVLQKPLGPNLPANRR